MNFYVQHSNTFWYSLFNIYRKYVFYCICRLYWSPAHLPTQTRLVSRFCMTSFVTHFQSRKMLMGFFNYYFIFLNFYKQQWQTILCQEPDKQDGGVLFSLYTVHFHVSLLHKYETSSTLVCTLNLEPFRAFWPKMNWFRIQETGPQLEPKLAGLP